MRDYLTELEGGILSEIHHCGSDTAFKVRRAFELSPSLEWRGSAGSVYPAIRRLVAGGRVRATPRKGGRKALVLELTEPGRLALDAWACDPDRATSPGIDPFRLRAGIWRLMSRDRRSETLKRIAARLREHLAVADLVDMSENPVEEERWRLGTAQQRARLMWIEAQFTAEGALGSDPSSSS